VRLQLTHRRASLVLQAVLIAEIVVAIWGQQWFVAFITAGIVAITLLPVLLERRFHVHIPPQFQLFAIAFVFGSLFLGEVHSYYTRFWWWDLVLHAMSGFLLGIVGFLLVHLLNEAEEIGIHMKPGFVAFFAFLFALGMGVLWELFEFAMDTFFGTNMQKAMLGDPSGLTDTMLDLLVDAAGALVITTYGYVYLSATATDSFLRRWISAFIRHNPGLFRR
jgi:uncharacterized membrane protein YjdF